MVGFEAEEAQMRIGTRVVHVNGGPMGTVVACRFQGSWDYQITWGSGGHGAWYGEDWIRRAPLRRRLHRLLWICWNEVRRKLGVG